MRQLLALLRAQYRSLTNSWRRADRAARWLRGCLLALGLAVFLLIFAGAWRVFVYLLFGLDPEVAELGPPLVIRLVEMAHLLFFVMLFISSLSVSLTVLYLTPEIAHLHTTPLSTRRLLAERFVLILIRSSAYVLFAAVAILAAYSLVVADARTAVHLSFSLLVFLAFLPTPVMLGTLSTMLIVRFIPLARAKTFLTLLMVIALVLIVLGLRGMTPERFLRPRLDPNLGLMLSAVAMPAMPWFPSAWAANGIIARSGADAVHLAILSLLATLLTLEVCARFYRPSLGRIAAGARTTLAPRPLDPADLLTRLLPRRLRLIAIKDLKLFWRDPAQWSQLIVLFALVVVYVFNFRQFRNEIATPFLRDAISLLNLVLAGFVLVTVANRFVFSAVAFEGAGVWLPWSSPMRRRDLLAAKACTAFLPLLMLAEAIVVLANRALDVSPGFAAAASLIVALMTAVLTVMGVSLGALAPRFDLRDPAQIGMTRYGILYMILGFGYVVCFVLTVAAHTVLVWRERFLPGETTAAGLIPLAAAIGLNLAGALLPWREAARRIDRLEIR